MQAKVCCNPVVVGPRTGRSVRPASRARPEPVCLIPQGRTLEVSTEVRLDPRELQASCVPRTGLAVPRTFPPKRSGLPGFYVRGGRRTQVWRDPAHFSRAHCLGHSLPCLRCRLRCRPCSDRSRCDPTSKQLALSGPVVPNEIVSRLALKAATEVCCNPPSISISDLPGPTTTGFRPSPRRGGTSASTHYCVRPWSKINEPEPCSAHCGMWATQIGRAHV